MLSAFFFVGSFRTADTASLRFRVWGLGGYSWGSNFGLSQECLLAIAARRLVEFWAVGFRDWGLGFRV